MHLGQPCVLGRRLARLRAQRRGLPDGGRRTGHERSDWVKIDRPGATLHRATAHDLVSHYVLKFVYHMRHQRAVAGRVHLH